MAAVDLSRYGLGEGAGYETPQQFVQRIAPTDGTQVDYEKLGESYLKGYKDYLKSHNLPEPDIDAYAGEMKSRFFDGALSSEDFNARFEEKAPVADSTKELERGLAGDALHAYQSYGSGAAGMIQSAARGANEMAADFTYDYPLFQGEDLGEDVADDKGNIIGRVTEKEKEGLRLIAGDAYFGKNQRYKDETESTLANVANFMEGGKIDNPDFIPSVLGGAVIQMGAPLGIAKVTGSGTLAGGVGLAIGGASMADEAAQKYIQKIEKDNGGVVNQQDKHSVAVLNSTLAGLDLIPLHVIGNGGGIKWLDDISGGSINKFLTSRAGRIGTGGVTEGVTEMAQNLGSNLIDSKVVAYDPERNVWSGTAEAGEGGAIAGMFMTALMGNVGGRRAGATNTTEDEDGVEQQAAPPSPGRLDPLAEAEGDVEDPLVAARRKLAEQEAAKASADIANAPRVNPLAANPHEIDVAAADDIDTLLQQMGLPLANETQQSDKQWGSDEYANHIQATTEKEVAQLEKNAKELERLKALQATIQRTTGDQDQLRANEMAQRKLQGTQEKLDTKRQQLARVNADQSSRGGIPVIQSQYSNMFAAAETKWGLPRGMLSAFASIESNFTTDAVSPTGATGLFQFTTRTGKRYGLFPNGQDIRRNAAANTDAAGHLASDNIKYLRSAGIPITTFTVYMAHQQGAGGTAELFQAARTGNISPRLRKNMDLNAGKGLDAAQFLTKMQGIFERKSGAKAGSMIPPHIGSAIKPIQTDYDSDLDSSYEIARKKNSSPNENRTAFFDEEFTGPKGGTPIQPAPKENPFDTRNGLRDEIRAMAQESAGKRDTWPDWIQQTSSGKRSITVDGGKRTSFSPSELTRAIEIAESSPDKLTAKQASIIDAMVVLADKRLTDKGIAAVDQAFDTEVGPPPAEVINAPETTQPGNTNATQLPITDGLTPIIGEAVPAGQADAGTETGNPTGDPATGIGTTGTVPADASQVFSEAALAELTRSKQEPLTRHIGKQAKYGDYTGELIKKPNGIYIRDKSGDVIVESGLSDRPTGELGVEILGTGAANRRVVRTLSPYDQASSEWTYGKYQQDSADAKEQQDWEASQAAKAEAFQKPQTDWATNTIALRGRNYQYVGTHSNAKGETIAVVAEINGKQIVFRNPDIIAAIESSKIAYEIESNYDEQTQLEAIRAVESDPAILKSVEGNRGNTTGDAAKNEAGAKQAAKAIKSSGYKPPILLAKGGKQKKRQPTQADVDLAIHNLDNDIELTPNQQELLNALFADQMQNGDTRDRTQEPAEVVEAPVTLDEIIPDEAVSAEPDLEALSKTLEAERIANEEKFRLAKEEARRQDEAEADRKKAAFDKLDTDLAEIDDRYNKKITELSARMLTKPDLSAAIAKIESGEIKFESLDAKGRLKKQQPTAQQLQKAVDAAGRSKQQQDWVDQLSSLALNNGLIIKEAQAEQAVTADVTPMAEDGVVTEATASQGKQTNAQKIVVKRSKLSPKTEAPTARPMPPTREERQQAIRLHLESLLGINVHAKPADARVWIQFLDGLKGGVQFSVGKQQFTPTDEWSADYFSNMFEIRKAFAAGDMSAFDDGSGRIANGESAFQQMVTDSADILSHDKVDYDANKVIPITAKWILDNFAPKPPKQNAAQDAQDYASGVIDAMPEQVVRKVPDAPTPRHGTRLEVIISSLSDADAQLLRDVYYGDPPKTSQAAVERLRKVLKDSLGLDGDTGRAAMRDAMSRLKDVRVAIESTLYSDGKLLVNSVETNLRDNEGMTTGQVDSHLKLLQIPGMPAIDMTIPAEIESIANDMGIDSADIKGVYWKGKIHINPQNIQSGQELEAVIIEEMAHGRLYDITADVGYNNALLALYKGLGKDPDAALQKLAADNNIDLTAYLDATTTMTDNERAVWLTAEVLAKLPRMSGKFSTRAVSALNKVWGSLREAFRATGIIRLKTITQSDMVYLASRIAKASTADADVPRIITDLANPAIPVDPDAAMAIEYEADDDGIMRELPQFSLRRGVNGTNENVFDDSVADQQARILLQNRVNNSRPPSQPMSLRLGEMNAALRQRWQNYRSEARTDRESLRTHAVAWFKRAFFTDAGLGRHGDSDEDRALNREIGDTVRSIELEESAIGFALENDAIELDAAARMIFGKKSSKLTDVEQKHFSDVLRGKAVFSNPEHMQVVQHFRNRIDNASKQLLKRLAEQTNIYLAEITDPIAHRDTLDAMQDIANGIPYKDIKIPRGAHKVIKYYERQLTVRNNMGKYVTTSYRMFTDPNWNRKVRRRPEYNAAIDYMHQFMVDNSYDNPSREHAQTYINAMLDGMVQHNNPMSYQQSVDGRKRSELLMRKGDFDPAIRDLLGEINDPIHNYVNTMTSITRYVIGHDFQARIRMLGLASGMFSLKRGGHDTFMTHQFTQSGQDEWSMLEDVYMHPETTKQLAAMRQPMYSMPAALEWMTRATQNVKVANTVLSPTTAMRNLWSGFALVLAAGQNPLAIGSFIKAADRMRVARSRYSKQGFGNELIIAKQAEHKQMYDYIRLGIVRDGATSGELSRIIADMNYMMDMDSSKFTTGRKVLDFASRMYRGGDDIFKIVHFESELAMLKESGMSHEDATREAARRTRDMMPTYTMVPRIIKDIRLLPIIGTFPSYPWEVVRTTKNQMLYIKKDFAEATRLMQAGKTKEANARSASAAKRLAGMIVADLLLCRAGMWAWNSMMGVDADDIAAVDDLAGEYNRGGCMMFHKSADGDVSYTNMTSLLPVESVIIQPLIKGMNTAKDAESTSGAVTGFATTTLGELAKPYVSIDMTVQALIDVSFNTRGFTGQNIYTEGHTLGDLMQNPVDNFGDIKAAVGHLWKTGAPGILKTTFRDFIVASSHTIDEVGDGDGASFIDGMGAIAGGRVTRDGREFTLTDATAAMMGFRTQTRKMSVMARQLSVRANKDLNTATKQLKNAVSTTAPLSTDFIEGSAMKFAQDRHATYRPLIRTKEYLERHGKSPAEIVDILYGQDQGTIAKQDVEYLVRTGKTPAYRIDDKFMNTALKAFDNMDQARKWKAQDALAKRFQVVRQSIAQAESIVSQESDN